MGSEGCVLATNLIREEYNELLTATDPVDDLDAFVDLAYVTFGAMHASGLREHTLESVDLVQHTLNQAFVNLDKTITAFIKRPPCQRSITWYLPEAAAGIVRLGVAAFPLFHFAWDVVHEANMSKQWKSKQWLEATAEFRKEHQVFDTEDPDLLVVKRKSDGKIIKPPDFVQPNITEFAVPWTEKALP